jgi:fatty-acyl-CoA synthase
MKPMPQASLSWRGGAREGAAVTREEMLKFYDGKVAKWMIPDDVVFVADLPHTATGKLSKLTLRQQMKDYKLPSA